MIAGGQMLALAHELEIGEQPVITPEMLAHSA
jgi:hypothetical protein